MSDEWKTYVVQYELYRGGDVCFARGAFEIQARSAADARAAVPYLHGSEIVIVALTEKPQNPTVGDWLSRLGRWPTIADETLAATQGFEVAFVRIQRSSVTCIRQVRREGLRTYESVRFTHSEKEFLANTLAEALADG